jgi:hypothetical protein
MRHLLLILALSSPAMAADEYGAWPVIDGDFGSTGGGGIVIGGYRPVLRGALCVTEFTATEPNGRVHRNIAEFDARPEAGGTLCENGRWRALDGSGRGTTPLRVFLKDGLARRSP